MMSTSPTDVIRETLDMATVARFYGYPPNRAGFIACPFHGEKTPSLKLYPARWKCFGCGEGGDAIDFVRRLLGISFPEAIDRLSADFGLGVSNNKPDPEALAHIRAERAERERARKKQVKRINALCRRRRAAWQAMQNNPPIRLPDGDIIWPDEWAEAAGIIDYLDYLIDEKR